MTSIPVAALAAVLLLASTAPASAACVNTRCADTVSIEQARQRIQETCGCTREGQKHSTYKKCVRATLKAADLTALIPEKACRKLIMKCESQSICGKPNAVVCCAKKRSGLVRGKIVKNAAKCRNGSACGAFLGLYSKFDACNEVDATCDGPTTTTTSTTLPTTTTTTAVTSTTSTTVEPTTTTSTTIGTTSTTVPTTTTSTSTTTIVTTTTSTSTTSSTTTTTFVTTSTTSSTTTTIGGTTSTSTTLIGTTSTSTTLIGTTSTSTTLIGTTSTSTTLPPTTTSSTVIPTTTTSTTEPPTTTTSTSTTTTTLI